VTLFDPEPLAPTPAGPGSESAGPGPESAGPPAGAVRLRLVVAYDGKDFRGFASQPGQRTVAGELSRAISTFAGHPLAHLVCAGRTDAGVHASGQVVHLDVAPGLDLGALQKAVNSMLAPDIVVRCVDAAPEGFDARHSAKSRRYRYLVLESPFPDPLLSGLVWTVKGPLDLRAMSAAADALVGEHDFRAFCRRAPGADPGDKITRVVLDARWSLEHPDEPELDSSSRLLRFDVEALSFCHQMVRSIVGVLVDVGRGKRPASDVHWLLTSGDRSLACEPAPANGLCLVGVRY